MKLRRAAIVEMKSWLVEAATDLGLGSIQTNPVTPVDPNKLNAVHIHVGTDEIVKRSNRNRIRFPAVRKAAIIFELWMPAEVENPELEIEELRKILIASQLSNQCSIEEQQTYGPMNGGVPGAQAMQLIVTLTYNDKGPDLAI